MSRPQVKGLAHSILSRQKKEAKATGRPFTELLELFAIERFLHRLAISDQRSAITSQNWPPAAVLDTLHASMANCRQARRHDMPQQMRDAAIATTPFYLEAPLSILGYREEGEWVALALEMDLRGYGVTWEEALDELRELVQVQIGFAYEKGQPDMIWKDAEPEYWDQFRLAQRAGVYATAAETTSRQPEFHAGGLKVSSPAGATRQPQFMRANG